MKDKTALIPEKMIRKAIEKCQKTVPLHNFLLKKNIIANCSIIKVEKGIFPLKELASMYTALDVAKYIVVKCIKDEHPITNLQLQKILFYIQREYLFATDQPLFKDSFESWKFGPVVPKVYYRYCGFGGNEINFQIDMTIPKIKNEDKKVINRITEEKRVLMPWDLVKETQQKGGAWDRIFKDGKGNRGLITKKYIRRYG